MCCQPFYGRQQCACVLFVCLFRATQPTIVRVVWSGPSSLVRADRDVRLANELTSFVKKEPAMQCGKSLIVYSSTSGKSKGDSAKGALPKPVYKGGTQPVGN